jgi:hypothetical protein
MLHALADSRRRAILHLVRHSGLPCILRAEFVTFGAINAVVSEIHIAAPPIAAAGGDPGPDRM